LRRAQSAPPTGGDQHGRRHPDAVTLHIPDRSDGVSGMTDECEILGLGLCFEDLPVGRKFRTIGRTLTEADLVNFVGVTGMTEVLFTNREFLEHESDIKQRVVPAAMVYAFAEGLLVQATMQHTGLAFLHMELDVKGPTIAGDTIHVACEVVESRRSRSRPDRGLVRTFNEVRKQNGNIVLTYNPLRLVKVRGGVR
jgi:acyl dehydratase